MKGKKVCKECGEKILPEQKGVLLHTFHGYLNLEKVYFHFDCWIKFLNNKSMERATNQLNRAMGIARDIFDENFKEKTSD